LTEAFESAASRHWSDAEFLMHATRLRNADQLYGFAAECALKCALMKAPGCINDGALLRKYRTHVDELWELIPVQSVHRTAAGLVALLRSPTKPFADWSVDQRYDAGEAVAETVKKHRDTARRVLGALHLLGTRSDA
jgi:hypothetical protein